MLRSKSELFNAPNDLSHRQDSMGYQNLSQRTQKTLFSPLFKQSVLAQWLTVFMSNRPKEHSDLPRRTLRV